MDFNIKHLETVDSTNKLAIDLINKNGLAEGTVIWADEQTDGRGHANNFWESEKGKNLTLSIVLKPGFIEPKAQFAITQLISVAIRNVIIQYIQNQSVKIKWPNDVYINHKKVAGILIQNILKGNEIDYSVIGIGLNINQDAFLSDAPNPGSLAHFTQTAVVLEDVLTKLLIEISTIYSGFRSKTHLENLHKNYIDGLYRYKQTGSFREGKNIFTATLIGIGEYGKLKLKTEDDKILLFDFKEVEFV